MKRLALLILLVCAAPASASDLLVVGRSQTLAGPVTVAAGKTRIKAGGHRCPVPARTPLAALADSGLELALRDYGACAPSGLYVRGIAGEKERGRDGWVYKTGHGTPSTGAADPASRTRGRVLWFWCRMGKTGCQRTLEVAPEAPSAGTLRVRVRAYDDVGKGVPAVGATVTVGDGATAVTGSNGIAVVPLGAQTGTLDVVATQSKRIRSFPARVTVR